MRYFFLIVFLTCSTISHAMEMEMPDFELYSDEDPNYITFDSPAIHYPPHATEEHKQLLHLNRDIQQALPTDCIGEINQRILEQTNTHQWVARSTLAQSKQIPVNYYSCCLGGWYSGPWVHVKEVALHSNNQIVSLCKPCDLERTELFINTTRINNNASSNSFFAISKPVNKNIGGISINQTNPGQYATFFYGKKGKGNSIISIIDVEAQKIAHTINVPETNPYTQWCVGVREPVMHNQDLFYVDGEFGNKVNQYDMRSGKTNRNPFGCGHIQALSQHDGIPYIAYKECQHSSMHPTLSMIDLRNAHAVPLWITNKKEQFDVSTRLTAGKDFILFTNQNFCRSSNQSIVSMNLINKRTATKDSCNEIVQPYYNVNKVAFSLDDNKTVSYFSTQKPFITTSTIISLPPETIGSHTKTLQSAAALSALHRETKCGPLCKDKNNPLSLSKEDFSPELWSIIKARDLRKSAYLKGIKNNEWCSIQ